MTEKMTETERLRALLDKRGVEWEDMSSRPYVCTSWRDPDGEPCTALEGADDIPDGKLSVQALLTPEQAVEATLGRGTCKNVAEPDDYSDKPFTCSECGARGPMGNGTYHMASSFTLPDGTIVHGDSWPVWKFCPNCGREVEQ